MFYKLFCPIFSKSLHIHFNPLKNGSPILLLNGLVMVTNESCLQMFQKINGKRAFTPILRISFTFEIFQILLATKIH